MKRHLILVVLFLFVIGNIFQSLPVSALDLDETEKLILPDIISEEEAEENGYISRSVEEETDLNTFVFNNSQNIKTARMFDHPVKYEDSDGTIKDISLSLKKNNNGDYVPAQHEILTVFPASLSDGVRLNFKDIDIKMIPEAKNVMSAKSDDGKTVSYIADENTAYEYSLTYTGFKENIVVSEYNGQTEYTFLLYTNGLSLERVSGAFYLVDKDGISRASVGDIIVFTSDEKNNTFGNMVFDEISKCALYRITIILDDDFLSSADTQYPIRIDPTIEYVYPGTIEDLTINSDDNVPNGTSGSLFAGKRQTYGKSRFLMRFPGFNYSLIDDLDKLISAKVEIRDLMCETTSATVYCYTCLSTWNESTTTWSSMPSSYLGGLCDSKVVSYSQGLLQPVNHRYSFDITSTFSLWISSPAFRSYGIVFKLADLIENGNTYLHKTFASYNRATYKPSLTVKYVDINLYYSTYEPSKFNYSGSILHENDITDAIQYRLGSYGYAFRHIYYNSHQLSYDIIDGELYGYRQRVGSFGDITNPAREYIFEMPLSQYQTLDDDIYDCFEADAERLGYTITRYIPTSNTVSQFGTNSRLVAVVYGDRGYDYYDSIGRFDFIFYMQHNNGVWSYKKDAGPVTNRSIFTNTILTNSNIIEKAGEGFYHGGTLIFFEITRPAIIDYPHGDFSYNYNLPLYYKDKAGDNNKTAVKITTGSKNCKIDFANDCDVFWFIPSSTRTYTISTTCSSGANLNGKIKNEGGTTIYSDTNSGQVNLQCTLNKYTLYYIEISNASKTMTNYKLIIN